MQSEDNMRDSCQKERQHQIKDWPSELVPLFKPFLFGVLWHFSNRRSKLPVTDIWAARFLSFFSSPNFQSLQGLKHVSYTNNTRALCYGIFLFVGVVFEPYHVAFGISIGAKQVGEGAELSDNGNIRLCLPLEKTATTTGEGKTP